MTLIFEFCDFCHCRARATSNSSFRSSNSSSFSGSLKTSILRNPRFNLNSFIQYPIAIHSCRVVCISCQLSLIVIPPSWIVISSAWIVIEPGIVQQSETQNRPLSILYVTWCASHNSAQRGNCRSNCNRRDNSRGVSTLVSIEIQFSLAIVSPIPDCLVAGRIGWPIGLYYRADSYRAIGEFWNFGYTLERGELGRGAGSGELGRGAGSSGGERGAGSSGGIPTTNLDCHFGSVQFCSMTKCHVFNFAACRFGSVQFCKFLN